MSTPPEIALDWIVRSTGQQGSLPPPDGLAHGRDASSLRGRSSIHGPISPNTSSAMLTGHPPSLGGLVQRARRRLPRPGSRPRRRRQDRLRRRRGHEEASRHRVSRVQQRAARHCEVLQGRQVLDLADGRRQRGCHCEQGCRRERQASGMFPFFPANKKKELTSVFAQRHRLVNTALRTQPFFVWIDVSFPQPLLWRNSPFFGGQG